MRIRVKLFSWFREYLPAKAGGEATVELPEGATVAGLLMHLRIDRHIESVIVNGQPEPDGERILLEVALDFWNGSGKARFSELYMLNLFEREDIFALYQALCEGPHAILDWIEGKPQE